MSMVDASLACKRVRYIIFFPDHLCPEIWLSSKQETSLTGLHPWGCLIKWKNESKDDPPGDKQSMLDDVYSEGALLICGFVKEDSVETVTLTNAESVMLNTSAGQLIVSQEVQATCLVPGCRNCRTGQLLDRHGRICSPFSLSGHLIGGDSQLVWISFSWSLLPALRRFCFLEMLNSLLVSGSSEEASSVVVKHSSITCEQLIQLERNHLNKTFGYPLSSVIVSFTRPLIPKSWPKSFHTTDKSSSLACSATNRFSGCHRLVQSTLGRLLKASRTFTLIKHCQSPEMASLGVGYRASRSSSVNRLWHLWFEHSRRPTATTEKETQLPMANRYPPRAWPPVGLSFSLFSAIHLIVLLLGLVTPLWSPEPGVFHQPLGLDQQLQHQLSGNQTRDCTSLSPRLHSLLVLVTSTNCSRVPTLGWFYTGSDDKPDDANENSSNATEMVLAGNHSSSSRTVNATDHRPQQQPPVHILSVIDLVQNLSSIHSSCWFKLAENWIQFLACELTRLLFWLESGEPAGLKINLHLARFLGDFFVYHLVVWRTYASFLVGLLGLVLGLVQQLTSLGPLHCHHHFYASLNSVSAILLSTVYLTTTVAAGCGTANGSGVCSPPSVLVVLITYVSSVLRLTVALVLSVATDLVTLTAVHLHTFYLYTLRIVQLEFRVIVAAWRLCRNRSKWNPLRCRVDTVLDMCNPPVASGGYRTDRSPKSTPGGSAASRRPEQPTTLKALSQAPVNEDVHLDRLLVSTLLGLAVGICLLPTTLAFYLTFALVRLSIFCFQQLLLTCIDFALKFPVSALLAWSFSLEQSRSELIVEPSMVASPRFPFIRLQLIRPSFVQAYRKNRLIKCVNLFGPRISLLEAVKRLVTVIEF